MGVRVAALAGWAAHRASRSLMQLVGGLGTGLLAATAAVAVLAVAAGCLVGIGLPLLAPALRLARSVADRERARLSRWGPEIVSPYQQARHGIRVVLRDPATARDLCWLAVHAVLGSLLGIVGMLLPILVVRDGSVPIWWQLVPDGVANSAITVLVTVRSWPSALLVGLMGLGWVALWVAVGPALARVQAAPGRWLLPAVRDVDLSQRVAELTATRAAALDAHTAELRRIERALHDGTQNRIVAVTVLLGAARRALSRDPAAADEILDRAQDTAEHALAELRGVVRGILPPVLADRGLEGALAALAADCRIPCRLDVPALGRLASSIEATAYFVVAEALTNVARYSGATQATVALRRAGDRLLVRISDDGKGGADERNGSGLRGIRGRIAAHDGRFTVTSPDGGPTVLEAELPCGS